MQTMEGWRVLAVLLVWATTALGAPDVIGVAVARGGFALDSATVRGTGTLFDGSLVETRTATGELKLEGGVRALLNAGSRARVYRDRLLLERGTGQIQPRRCLQDRGAVFVGGKHGAAKVVTAGSGKVLVAALSGPVQVKNAKGLLLASLQAGQAVEMTPGPEGAAAASQLTGILQFRAGAYLLREDTLGITVQLVGNHLDKEINQCVEVSGVLDPTATPAQGAAQVIRVLQLNHCSKKRASGVPAKTLVIAGVVAAGAATGAAVGLTRDAETPISQ